jgi:hypothetical protein
MKRTRFFAAGRQVEAGSRSLDSSVGLIYAQIPQHTAPIHSRLTYYPRHTTGATGCFCGAAYPPTRESSEIESSGRFGHIRFQQ